MKLYYVSKRFLRTTVLQAMNAQGSVPQPVCISQTHTVTPVDPGTKGSPQSSATAFIKHKDRVN